ncbi:MAG TPA: hypothetical protein VI685_20725 [Candidatus Angelobacter sp.]
MKTTFILLCGLLLAGLAVAQNTNAVAIPVATKETCNCYYTSDCTGVNYCQGYGNCTPSGKLDGTCSTIAVASDSAKTAQAVKEKPEAISAAVDSYFQAFLKAVKKGGGVPDPELVAAAQKVQLSQNGHDGVEHAVWVSLDAVMGWDFMYPNKLQRSFGAVGNIREVPSGDTAARIVEATRRGLLDSIQAHDPSKVDAPLQAFWAENPTYIPQHLGRCYPHGHKEVTDQASSVACQTDTLQRVAAMLIRLTGFDSPKISALTLPEETSEKEWQLPLGRLSINGGDLR